MAILKLVEEFIIRLQLIFIHFSIKKFSKSNLQSITGFKEVFVPFEVLSLGMRWWIEVSLSRLRGKFSGFCEPYGPGNSLMEHLFRY